MLYYITSYHPSQVELTFLNLMDYNVYFFLPSRHYINMVE